MFTTQPSLATDSLPLSGSTLADFEQVVRNSESAARRVLSGQRWTPSEALTAASIANSFRKNVEKDARKVAGAFFTGPALGASLVSQAKPSAIVCDPACGVGDLLVPHASRMPLAKSLGETLEMWGDHLRGTEMQEGLLRLARSRLVLSAAERAPATCDARGIGEPRTGAPRRHVSPRGIKGRRTPSALDLRGIAILT